MGACHPCGAVVPPPDAVVGSHGPRAPVSCQNCIGFGDSLPIGPPPIADGIAPFGCAMEVRDNVVMGTTGGALRQLATK